MAKLTGLFAVILLALFAVGYDYWFAAPPPVTVIPAAEAPPAPPIAFTTLDNRQVSGWQDIAAPTIVVNFWASWCAPCLAEMPQLLEMTAKANGQVALVAISTDDDPAAATALINKWRAQYPTQATSPQVYWVWDRGKRLSLGVFQTTKVPETIVIDAKRRMVQKIVGQIPEAATFKSLPMLAPPRL